MNQPVYLGWIDITERDSARYTGRLEARICLDTAGPESVRLSAMRRLDESGSPDTAKPELRAN